MARQRKLTPEHKAFAVIQLARYVPPTTVATMLKDEFGIVTSPQSMENYDPTKKLGRRLSKDLRELFAAERKKYRDDIEDIPESGKAVRIRNIAEISREFRQSQNRLGAMQAYRQIAEEMGGGPTRREHSGPGGGPMEMKNIPTMTDEQLDQRVDYLLTKAKGEPNGGGSGAAG